ncbi:HPP family protein (plasmid) [Thioclava sp. 'Guangxiensis']|uniref:HPP family protein n=1 Tax=Thioclava sp. 'Guangxiensis' TaxID=3149044 RepID=UPI0032C41F8F
MNQYFTRSLPKPGPKLVLLAGLGGLVAIACLRLMTDSAHLSLIMAPFGASCVLLFAVPGSPLSQPTNVVGGHFIATLVGLLLRLWLPDVWWALALAVGLAIAAMVALRVTHPPAGADPLVVFATDPGFGFLILPVLSGSLLLVIFAVAYHRLSGQSYPRAGS